MVLVDSVLLVRTSARCIVGKKKSNMIFPSFIKFYHKYSREDGSIRTSLVQFQLNRKGRPVRPCGKSPKAVVGIGRRYATIITCLIINIFHAAESISGFFFIFLFLLLVAIPSSPRNAIKEFVNETAFSITWEPPEDTGGRSDIYYEIECSANCSKTDEKCSGYCDVLKDQFQDKTATRFSATGLQSTATYTILIFAKNGVSELAKETSTPLSITIFAGKRNNSFAIF